MSCHFLKKVPKDQVSAPDPFRFESLYNLYSFDRAESRSEGRRPGGGSPDAYSRGGQGKCVGWTEASLPFKRVRQALAGHHHGATQ